MLYQQVSIRLSAADSNTYEAVPAQNEPQESAAIFSKLEGDVYELGVDRLPADIENITNKIHNKPERVFAVKDGSAVSYFGLNAAE